MRFGEYIWLHGLWLLPILVLLAMISFARRRTLLRRFAEGGLLAVLNRQVSRGRQWIKVGLLTLSLGLITIALARPQWNPQPTEVQRRGRDVCFIIDVSRSMLAEDLRPNRLDRAKLWMRDVADSLRGDRIALIAFAGNAVVKAPLTHDYNFFRLALEDLSTESVSRGGTLIGDAIRTAMVEIFGIEPGEPVEARHRDIILITDGEDHESFPVEAAGVAGDAGIRIIAIGLGDEDVGRPIPIEDERGRRGYVMHEGKRVLTQLDPDTLRKIALATPGGKFLNVATGTIDLDTVYGRFIEEAEQNDLETVSAMQFQERFQLFLGAALMLLVLEAMLSDRRRRVYAAA